MSSIEAAGIAGGAGIIGALMQRQSAIEAGNTQRDLAAQANKTSIELANTAYQRSVSDMKAAGLNPALMYGSAGAADVPSLAVAQTPQGNFPGEAVSMTGQAVAGALQQAQSLKQGQQAIDNNYLMQLEQIAKIKAEIANLPSNSGMLALEKQLAAAQARLAEFNAMPNNLNQLSTKLLSRFIEHLESKYGKSGTAAGKSGFVGDMMRDVFLPPNLR